MTVEIKKVPGGVEADGLRLIKGKCGCTSLAKCCYSWSKLKHKGNDITYDVKLTSPDTTDNFNWSYKAVKDGVTVTVTVEDARDKDTAAAFIPPAASEWESLGWEIVEKTGEREDGIVWRCAVCKWLYKEDEEGTPFEDLPDDWSCPTCGAGKNVFEKIT
jgi:rubredoxin